MLFNSLQFLIFFPIVTLCYFLLPHRFRWLLLLLASCIFYMAFIPSYILILIFTIVVDYFAGLAIERSSGRQRKLWLIASLTANIGVLVIFKYLNTVTTNLNALAHFLDWNYSLPLLAIIMPIGLSFHTFQAMSYTIEVYEGNLPAERHFGIYALFVMFYPQLVAGPIERPQHLLPQLHEPHNFDYQRVTDGLKLMAWGMFKKVVIADRLAVFVNATYNNLYPGYIPEQGIILLIATIFFAFQVYCDFSGYSDIAIGAAQVMGMKLSINFRRPFFAESITEYWKRWHISLTSWFRDYLYLYLNFASKKRSTNRQYLNLVLVFVLSGLWHGADATFIIWGALHGAFLVVSLASKQLRQQIAQTLKLDKFPRFHHALQVGMTFALVCFAIVFFRAGSVSDALFIINTIALDLTSNLSLLFSQWSALTNVITSFGLDRFDLIIAVISIIFLLLIEYLQGEGEIAHLVTGKPGWLRWAAYYFVIFAIIILGKFEALQFIYFQF